MKTPSVKAVRCAIYTRVSTEHGLDQEFNSLDAQYEAASAYIKSQAHASWTQIRSRYDDGGYSGGSTDRPDLQRLLEDIRARKIDVIVVYKVDRLTRSLADFAKLVELFDANGVSFVSVTQQFNTTTSMGRLTLNVLLSFAQFEREVTSERIRDKIAASKRKGLWVGGNLPLGYEMKDGKIAIVEEEAELVRSIYRRYLELGGVNELLRDLKEHDIRTKSRLLSTGVTRGGIPFGRGALYYVLSNHFYIGEVKYKNKILPGEQPPIMDRTLFEAVRQKSLAQWSHRTILRNKADHLLTGLLFDDAGHRMIPTHATKAGVRYRYYASTPVLHGEARTASAGSVSRIPPSAHHQTRARPQDLSVSAARHGDHTSEPGLGNGHHVHPDGAWLRLSRRRARLGDPPGSVLAAIDHDGGGLLRRDAGGCSGSPRQAGHLQHRSGLAISGSAFTGKLTNHGIAISMDGKGAWRDNVFVERLWRSVKYEEVYLRAYESVSEARNSIGCYFDFYNRRRPHSSLDGNTPDQAYFNQPPFRLAA